MNIWIFILVFCISSAGAWLIACKGQQLGFSDLPEERSSHILPTPKGGGIGILGAFLILSFYFEIPTLFMGAITFVSLLSLVGDRMEISPKIRLLLQALASLCLLWSISPFFEVNSWNSKGWISFGVILFLILYVVGTANFYNFMDGINGIAAITGGVAFALLAYVSFSSVNHSSFVNLSLGLSFACLGFLPWNLPKAKVFMGDVGSILLGLAFAGLVIALSESMADFLCFNGFLFLFYADELQTLWERIQQKASLLEPHRLHLYQVLANEGNIAHWKISLSYGSIQLFLGIILLYLKDYGEFALLAALLLFFLLYSLIAKKIKGILKIETKEKGEIF